MLTHQPGPGLFSNHALCLQVRDIVFLHKYNEPVLLILHEVHPTWPARYRDAKDTMALAALSVNVVHKRHPRIWEASGLPSDTFRLIPVPTGGALALSQNMIMYHTQVPVPAMCRCWVICRACGGHTLHGFIAPCCCRCGCG